MILHCPSCGEQHIDAPEVPVLDRAGLPADPTTEWTNPPHRSHKCGACGHIWRPADVATNGVAKLQTHGKEDSAPPRRTHGYLLHKLSAIVPLFQEARDALSTITELQRRLRGISPTLAERMDTVGEYSPADWAAGRRL